MKKFSIITVLAMVGTMAFTSVASAQCKVEDIFAKYKGDTRCNSVNMSKEMLSVIVKQRGDEEGFNDIKNLSSVRILTVKVPKDNKMYGNSFSFSSGDGTNVYIDDDAITTTSKGDSKDTKEAIEKKVKEKQAQKEADRKKKFDELIVLKQQVSKEVEGCIEASKYTELMSINENGKQVTYYAKQEAEKIKEFIVVTNSNKEYSIIIIKGDDIKIQSVSRLSDIIPSADIDVDYLN